MKNLVMLYTKFPELGKTKTRIAKETNELFAWTVGIYSLWDTLNKTSNSSHYDFIAVVNSKEEARLFKEGFGIAAYVMSPEILQLDQSGRFTVLFTQFIEQYKKVILIPSDVPAITQKTIIQGFDVLDFDSYVFGPEYNGGVYLIGMNKSPQKIFQNVRWSTEHSVKDLIANAKGANFLLELKGDLNTSKDLLTFKKDIEAHAPLLYRELQKTNFYAEVKKEYAYC